MNSFSLEDHFRLIYKARITSAGKIIVKETDHNNDYVEREENIIDIKLLESEFANLMNGYGNYLTLIYGITDPVAQDMFEKLMIYLTLKK